MLSSDFPSVKLIDLPSVIDRGKPHSTRILVHTADAPGAGSGSEKPGREGAWGAPLTTDRVCGHLGPLGHRKESLGEERQELARLGLRVSETLSARGRDRIHF